MPEKPMNLFQAQQMLYSWKPRPLCAYAVAAYWSPGDRWKVLGDLWPTEEAAQKASEKLPKGWTNITIFKLDNGVS